MLLGSKSGSLQRLLHQVNSAPVGTLLRFTPWTHGPVRAQERMKRGADGHAPETTYILDVTCWTQVLGYYVSAEIVKFSMCLMHQLADYNIDRKH